MPPNDLPPRTWQTWWLAWPKWFRIGCYAALGLALLHVAVAIRIGIGLIESAEIRQLRSQGARIEYDWEWNVERFPGEHLLTGGLRGRSCRNVVSIADFEGDEGQLKCIAERFPRICQIFLHETDVTLAELRELNRCRELVSLDLTGTNVDDAGIQELANCKSKIGLRLTGTLVTNESLASLQRMKLSEVYLDETDVTRDYGATENIVDSRFDVLYSIRWSDGHRSASFRHPFVVQVHGRKEFLENESQIRFPFERLSGRRLYWSSPDTPVSAKEQIANDRFYDLLQRGCGEIQVTLQIGDHVSQPASVLLEENSSVCRVEFLMPCTKAEALQSAKSE